MTDVNLKDYFKNFEEKLLVKMPKQEEADITSATRLLEERREMVEVEHALIAQKEEFQMRKVILLTFYTWSTLVAPHSSFKNRFINKRSGKSSTKNGGIRAKGAAAKGVSSQIRQILKGKRCEKGPSNKKIGGRTGIVQKERFVLLFFFYIDYVT